MANNLNQLAKRLKKGDLSVFDEIYYQTYRQVFFIVLPILNDRSLAEDIMQDTYMKVLQSISTYQDNNFFAYLLTIAKNLAINEYNKRKRTILADDSDLDHVQFSLSDHIEWKIGKEELISEALSLLDETEKSVVLLYNIENLTHKEIALILNKPIGTITWTYAKAVKKIQLKIKEVDR